MWRLHSWPSHGMQFRLQRFGVSQLQRLHINNRNQCILCHMDASRQCPPIMAWVHMPHYHQGHGRLASSPVPFEARSYILLSHEIYRLGMLQVQWHAFTVLGQPNMERRAIMAILSLSATRLLVRCLEHAGMFYLLCTFEAWPLPSHNRVQLSLHRRDCTCSQESRKH